MKSGSSFMLRRSMQMKDGKPIIVAGIHAFPFNKDYSINFTMTTLLDPAATQENEMLTEVFNSFRLMGSRKQATTRQSRPQKEPESR